ncbi:MAG: hypothetical protein L3J35_01800 [Bacteroidales bacterium]|nr:hypothetical protein [Bacteroidales bacterium]
MAKQKGPIKYIGTLGDIRHFKIKNTEGYFAGMIGGPTAEQIKTDPAFARTRENMSEFGGSAIAAKAVRVAFGELVQSVADSRITGRLTALMKKINKEDTTGIRGQRPILVTQYPEHLKGTEFNKNITFGSIMYAPFTITPNVDRNSSDLVIPAFKPKNSINAPVGATHFRIVNAIGVISDYAFDLDTKQYEAVDDALNMKMNIEYSPYLDLSSNIGTDTTITAALAGAPVMSTDVIVLNAVGIEFYQEVNTEYYLFASGHAAKIKNTF